MRYWRVFRLWKLLMQETISWQISWRMYWKYWWSKIAGMALFEHGNECVWSYAICVIFVVIALTISIGIGACFAYKYMNRNKENVSKYE